MAILSLFRIRRPGMLLGFAVAALASGFGSVPVVEATAISPATQSAAAYAIDPPLGVAGAAPLVMLNLSRDHQLFYKAYNDFSDLDGDGALDTTYKNAFTYAGYFDPTKCYTYSSGDGYFIPKGNLDATRYCSSAWSGNFLNWATMTRADEVRKILYGGLRSTDTTDKTVLERAALPTDAHSFAKFYNGNDIGKLTPFSPLAAPPSKTFSRDSVVDANNGSLTENASNTYTLLRLKAIPADMLVQVGDQITITSQNGSNAAITLQAPVRYLNRSNPGYTGTANLVELRVQSGMFSGRACTTVANCISVLREGSSWTITNNTRQGISFCNTTVGMGSSTTDTSPPLIRAHIGDYALWASNEKVQCKWQTEDSNTQSSFADGFLSNGNRMAFSDLGSSGENPAKNGSQGTDWDEYNARVQVCVAGKLGAENCKQYPDATKADNKYKPVGLLQKYGETGSIKFGLVTPTFDHNASGGVLRAAVPGPGTNDGNFISNEVDAATGQFRTGTAAKGIISNINALRIYGYSYSDRSYVNSNGCNYQQIGITSGTAGNGFVKEGNCSSWGNPMAESYIETLRYLAGKQPTTAFASGSEDTALGLSVVTTWSDPITEANFCAPLNVINFNASSLSYDTDAVGGYADLNTGKTAAQWTDLVGAGEKINGNAWFVGNTSATYAGTDKDLCSAKNVTAFSGLQGICPESPALKGGYLMAGAAYGAHVKRIRNLGNANGSPIVPDEDTSSLKVSTFGVQLATNTPQIRVPVPKGNGKVVTIIPAYRLSLSTGAGGGALVDFKVLSQTNDGTTARGKFYADWEDSFAGGDYDQDMWGIISYEITATKVRITTKSVSAATSNGQGFGYIVNGTTKDGPHFHSGIINFSYSDPTNPTIVDANGASLNNTGHINSSGGCNSCVVTDAATTAVYDVGSASAGTLQDPLLYAAKWGGFREDTTKPSGTDTPIGTDNSKWDSAGKGMPDNYFLVTDPGKLETSLDQLFRKILAKIASGTAAASITTSANGTGITYQATYEAERTDNGGKRATWIGALNGLWTDEYGYLRSDANKNGQLDDYTIDPVIRFDYQAGSQRTVATQTLSSDPKKFVAVGGGTQVELDDLGYVWSARQQLWDPALKTATNRNYKTAFSNTAGRYIFTWIDANNDGIVQSGEVVPFVWNKNGFTSDNYRYLNTDDPKEAQNIVNWIRGAEVTGMRNRTVDYGADTNLQGRVTRLGDIVNSTPVAIAAPAEAYDLLYNDTSYGTFRNTYRNRRQMVYVGANDGMLHAFNGGFYNTSCKRFTRQPDSSACTATDPSPSAILDTSFTAHPLGSEIWAYVPRNLQPHLRWLTDTNYKHTYYVDGSPVAFDAKVYPSTGDAVHVGGWGTFLVVPFRLGGGSITVPLSTDPKDPKNVTSESAYVVLDVTNPEAPPTLVAELAIPGTWTTSTPAVAVVRDVTGDNPNKFFLTIGSGPTDAKRVASTANLRVNVYDVSKLVNGNVTPDKSFDFGADSDAGKNSFAGDLIASDFNLDGKAERLYFGSVLGTGKGSNGRDSSDFGGHLWSVAIDGNPDATQWTGRRMLDLTVADSAPNGMPVTIRPTLGLNARGAPMVFFGTGRLYTSSDKATSGQQRMYGVIDTSLLPSSDAQSSATITQSNLIDVTGIGVYSSGAVTGVPDSSLITTNPDTATALSAVFDTAGVYGWYRNLSTNGNNPSERVVSAQALLGTLLLTTTYIPGTSICTGLGASSLYGLDYKTGTASGSSSLGTPNSSGLLNPSTSLGQGLPAPPSLHAGAAGDTSPNGQKTVTACTQTSTGAIVCQDVATLKPVTSGEQSWREPQGN